MQANFGIYCNRRASQRFPVHADVNRCGGFCAPQTNVGRLFSIQVNATSYFSDNVQGNDYCTPPLVSSTAICTVSYGYLHCIVRLFALYRMAVCTLSYGYLHSIVRLFARHRTAICTVSYGYLHAIARPFALYRTAVCALSEGY